MASDLKFALSPADSPGLIRAPYISPQAADKANYLLNLNHETYHIYFHNADHELHHLVAIYALGASPDQLQSAYDRNADYQKPQKSIGTSIMWRELHNPGRFSCYLGQPEYYEDYLNFFKAEITKNGLAATIREFVFCGDERADDMLARLHGGLLHPIIHLGYGIEFNQPIIVAEALASAAIHDTFMGEICFPAEEVARAREAWPKVTMMSLVERLQNDTALKAAISEDETHNKLATDLMPREGKKLISIIADYTVKPDELDQKLAEMIQVNCYLSGATQRPGKDLAFDFYIMHCTNLAPFYLAFLQDSMLSVENKCRLLEWKGRLDLAIYASCKAPKLYLQRIVDYQPSCPGNWDSIFSRAAGYADDGHTAKLIRAVKSGEVMALKYPEQPGVVLQVKDYLQLAHMVLDCVEKMDQPAYTRPDVIYFEDTSEEVLRLVARWIRFCGTKVAWKDVQALPTVS